MTVHLDEFNESRGMFGLDPIRVKNYQQETPFISLDGGPLDDLQRTIYESLTSVH